MRLTCRALFTAVTASLLLFAGAPAVEAQAGGPADLPAVTVRGQTYTPRSILARNMGSEADQTTAFPPHRIAGNIYYVGTRTLSAFLITTPAGHILINTYIPNSFKLRLKSASLFGYTQSGKCSKYSCNKLAKSAQIAATSGQAPSSSD